MNLSVYPLGVSLSKTPSIIGVGIYLDHAASTPLRPEVLRHYMNVGEEFFANPTGSHRLAQSAKKVLEEARDVVAGVLGCHSNEIIFTSGGTESANIALRSSAALGHPVLLTSPTEHHCVLEPAKTIGTKWLGVDQDGVVEQDSLSQGLEDTNGDIFLSVMAVNNETGVIQPIAELSRCLKASHSRTVLFVDAVQAVNYLDLSELLSHVDMASFSAHKFGGPKGVGILFVRRKTPFSPYLLGGGQEFDRRSGTQNVPGISATALALSAAVGERQETWLHSLLLGDILTSCLESLGVSFVHSGVGGQRIPGVVNLRFPGADNEDVLFLLDEMGVYVSGGASCASGALEPSHVLLAMGVSASEAKSCIRFSFSKETSVSDVTQAAEALKVAISKLGLA